jgi:hypothetical protein
MREQETAPREPIDTKMPDEIISVEDFGARIDVQVWYPPTQKIKLALHARGGSTPDKSAETDLPWMRQAKLDILHSKAYLAGIGAISLYLARVGDPSMHEPLTETDTTKPEVTAPLKNLSDLTIEDFDSLQPGDRLHADDIYELELFEPLVRQSLQPDDVWGHDAKWPLRAPLGARIKPTHLGKKKYIGQITDITLEVMDDAGQSLLDAKDSKGLFIQGENLAYNTRADLLAAVKESTIGFDVTASIRSSAGVFGIARTKLWYTAVNRPNHDDIRRHITKPVVENLTTVNPSQPSSDPSGYGFFGQSLTKARSRKRGMPGDGYPG